MQSTDLRVAVLIGLLVSSISCGPATQGPAPEQESPAAATAAAPVPSPSDGLLLVIMVRLGADMSALSNALWREDLAGVAGAATAIADHPPLSAAERERIQGVLGERFPDFVEADHRVHDSAARLAEHATAGELDAALEELAELQSGCVACHDSLRATVRGLAP